MTSCCRPLHQSEVNLNGAYEQEGPVIEIPGYRNLVDDRAALATQMMKETYQIPQLPDLITSDVSSPSPIIVLESLAVRCHWNDHGSLGPQTHSLKAWKSCETSVYIVDLLYSELLRSKDRVSHLAIKSL